MDVKDWRAIVKQIRRGKCTPLISDRAIRDNLFKGHDVVQAWARDIEYPLKDTYNLTRVAQYWTIKRGDSSLAKDEYLDFLKLSLLRIAKSEQGGSNDFLDALEEEIEREDVTTFEVASRLNLFDFANEPGNPLRILAELPVPIYITTSYHDFMEEALRAAGKQPCSEICYWRDELEFDVPSVFEENPDYKPTEKTPLVYHLHGREAHPSSMVLSEDDYLDFLVIVSQDEDRITPRVNQALADSLLILLGYELKGWDFRVLLRGLIKAKPVVRRPKSLSIQLLPEADRVERTESIQAYLQEYFKENKFDIYWGDFENFTRDLKEQWS